MPDVVQSPKNRRCKTKTFTPYFTPFADENMQNYAILCRITGVLKPNKIKEYTNDKGTIHLPRQDTQVVPQSLDITGKVKMRHTVLHLVYTFQKRVSEEKNR